MPAISIIIPAYNAEKYIEKCIHSIIGQSYSDFEAIIVDDGSTDHTVKIISMWSSRDARIRLVKNSRKGVSSARNCGIAEARARFITFLDSDDCLSPVCLETMLLMQRKHDCQCVVVSITTNQHELCGDIGCINKIIEGEKRFRLLVDNRNNIGGFVFNKLYLTEVIKRYHIMFDESIAAGEDLLFNFNYFRHIMKVAICKKKMYYYRLWQGSSVNCLENARWFDLLTVYKRIMSSGVSPVILDYFSYHYAQLILEALFRIKYCDTCKYTCRELYTLQKEYVKINMRWGLKENIKIALFRLFPEKAMKYKSLQIKSQ